MDIHRGDSLFPPNGHLFLRTRRYFFLHVWIINRDEFFSLFSFSSLSSLDSWLFVRFLFGRILREQYGVRTWDTCHSIDHSPAQGLLLLPSFDIIDEDFVQSKNFDWSELLSMCHVIHLEGRLQGCFILRFVKVSSVLPTVVQHPSTRIIILLIFWNCQQPAVSMTNSPRRIRINTLRTADANSRLSVFNCRDVGKRYT